MIDERKGLLLRVVKMPGEATRYKCESGSLECVNKACGRTSAEGFFHPRLFNLRMEKNAQLKVGGLCPKCGVGILDLRFHLIDVAVFAPVGKCDCEWFDIAPRPYLGNMSARKYLERLSRSGIQTLSQAMVMKLRCVHIQVVRDFCLDVSILAHERDRYAGAGRQREEHVG